MAHIFVGTTEAYPHLAAELLQGNTLKEFLKNLDKISKHDDAIYAWEAGNYEKFRDVEDAKSFTCFGFGVETLCEYYLTKYGHKHNIEFVQSIEDEGSDEVDRGIDHYAMSLKDAKKDDTNPQAKQGSIVYIQTKGTLNNNKEYRTNDGSRIMNFVGVASFDAKRIGQAYQARYVLFTTGKNIHYKMDNNTNNAIEVINYNNIAKMIDNDFEFWNRMRKDFGLNKLMPVVETDADFVAKEVDNV